MTDSAIPRTITAILLAAGESARMTQAKQLLPWHGRPLLQYQIEQLQALPEVAEIVVVLGQDAEGLRPLVPEGAGPPTVTVTVNVAYREGKSTSIQAGLRALSGLGEAILILAVDQPRPTSILRALVLAHLTNGPPWRITVPAYEGRRGHPPVFAASLVQELLATSEEREGLREVMLHHRGEVLDVPMDTPLVLTNLNTEDDYQKALALAS